MWPFIIDWVRIKAKEGDDLELSLSPKERALMLVVMLNIQAISQSAPMSMNIGDDSDAFDACISSIMSKLAG